MATGMALKRGPELDGLVAQARELATARSERTTSAHLLLALMTDSSTAGALLRGLEVPEGRVRSAMRAVGSEPAGLIDRVVERAQMIAQRAPSLTGPEHGRSGGLHLLAALAKTTECAASRCLAEAGYEPSAVANAALGCLTGGGQRALHSAARGASEPRSLSAGGSPSPPADAGRSEAPSGAAPSSARARPRPSSARKRLPGVEARLGPPAIEPTASEGEVHPRRASTPSERGGVDVPAVRPSNGKAGASKAAPAVQGPDGTAGYSELLEPWRKLGRVRSVPEARARSGALSEELSRLPLLGRIGRDLSAAARRGEIDPLIGRSRELEKIVDALNRRRGNVPCIVGEPGVGKTALVEGLALLLEGGELSGLEGRTLVQVNVGDLLAGTGVRGALAERLAGLRAEVGVLGGRVVVFLDEVHSLLAAAGGEAGEGAQELRAAMASGEFPCILATTSDAYRRYVEPDPGLERRLTRIDLDEPSLGEAVAIVSGVSRGYAEHHGVEYSEEAIDASVRLTKRYLTERRLPDKALAVLDLAGARARRHGARQVDRDEVATVVADLTGVPLERLAATDAERLLALESHLAARVVGHEASIARIAEALRRNAAGLGGRRPVGSFLLLGPTGVGKTETARALADYLFPGGGGMSRFDMSELSEPHSVARLVGAPPGYVGHEAGGHLTEAVRARPYQVVLLDEVEKAHPKVLMLLLQVLEDGRLTDGRGRLVDFTSTVVIMTSNLGAGAASRAPIGFSADREGGAGQATLSAARASLPPELWNRFDEVLCFEALSRVQVEEVARRMLRASARRLAEQRGIRVVVDPSVIGLLIDGGGYEPALGARPMRRAVQRLVESRVAEAVLRGEATPGDVITLRAEAGAVVVETGPIGLEPAAVDGDEAVPAA